ncbi:DUF488 family protein [Erwinia sp. CPCC 100877]|nr:DUF488 family protein [Erwinia sp. CPCC 100877]
MIQCKRVYEDARKSDGYRVLVDRLWPRGVKKSELQYDEWCKAITPSPELRREWHSDVIDFDTFSQRYRAELEQTPDDIRRLKEIARKGPLTLLYAAKDTSQNHALVLADYLRNLAD